MRKPGESAQASDVGRNPLTPGSGASPYAGTLPPPSSSLAESGFAQYVRPSFHPGLSIMRIRQRVSAVVFLITPTVAVSGSAQQGVTYTAEQSARGADVYYEQCLLCHGTELDMRTVI